MLLQNCSNHLQTDPFQLLGNLKKDNDCFQDFGVEIKHILNKIIWSCFSLENIVL